MSSSPSPASDPVAPQPRTTGAPAFAARAIGGFGTSIVVGAALGVGAWVSDQLIWPYSLLIPANAIGAWLGVAFALGASARTIPTGALRGLVGLLSAVAAYYVLNAVFGQGFRAIGAAHAATIWGGVAIVAGPVMGGAGAVWRHGHGWPRAIGVALLSAALIAEGVVFGGPRLIRVDQLGADPGALLYAAEIVLGAVLPWLLLGAGERLRGYLATTVLGIAGAIAIDPVTTVLRELADRF
jgi:Family of unknown function (DUF6518)